MVVLLTVAEMIFAMVAFSYVFLWSRSPALWTAPPRLGWLGPILGGYAAASVAAVAASLVLRRSASWGPALAAALVCLSASALAGAWTADASSWWTHGLRPQATAQGATVFALISFQALFLLCAGLMAGYVLARTVSRLVSSTCSSTGDLVSLFFAYAAGQGALGATLVRLFPASG